MAKKDSFKRGEFTVSGRIRKRLEDALDINFSVAQIPIATMEEFEATLLTPFEKHDDIFYRGERICSPQRRLVPTFLLTPQLQNMRQNTAFTHITGQTLFDFKKGRRFVPYTKPYTASLTLTVCTRCSHLHSIIST